MVVRTRLRSSPWALGPLGLSVHALVAGLCCVAATPAEAGDRAARRAVLQAYKSDPATFRALATGPSPRTGGVVPTASNVYTAGGLVAAPPSPGPVVPAQYVAEGPVAVRPGVVNNYGGLGTYYPTPNLLVRGNGPVGGGYSPLNTYGQTTLSLYGPISPFRATAAPVQVYTRGYDGTTTVTPGTSFSTPNLPGLTPVIYPSRGTVYYGFPDSGRVPQAWGNASDWLDQN